MREGSGLFEHEVMGEELVIRLFGEIDHHSAVSVRSEIDGLIFEVRPRRVILDLSRVSFMDSSGLGLIMGRYSLAKQLGGALLLRSPTSAVMRILSLAGMERIVRIEKNFEEDDTDEEK